MSVSKAVVEALVKGVSGPNIFRLLSTQSLPNETISKYEFTVEGPDTQLVTFLIYISTHQDDLLGYRIYDWLGNELKSLDDSIIQPYFSVRDNREYSPDYSKVAIRFGRQKWY